VYEITVTEEYAKIYEISRTLTSNSRIIAKIADLCLMDSVEGTYLWVYLAETCPKHWCSCTVNWFGFFSNHTASLEGSLVLMEEKVKEQVARLKLGHLFMLWGNSAIRCNNIVPPRWKTAGKWDCAYSHLWVSTGEGSAYEGGQLGLREVHLQKGVGGGVPPIPGQPGNKEGLPGRVGEAGGRQDLGMGELAKEAIISAVGLSFIPFYWIMGPLAMTIPFLIFIRGLVRLVVTIIMLAFAIYRLRWAGLWMLGAFWSLPFQLIITPFRWASGAAAEIADRVGTRMECHAHHKNVRRGRRLPPAALEEMEIGG
jgi:hypothetical protein